MRLMARAFRACGLALLLALLSACGSGSKVVRGDGLGIAAIQALPAHGDKYRVIVAPVIDRSHGEPDTSLTDNLPILSIRAGQDIYAKDILAGIHDMLVTDLFAVGPFIVLEREGLDQVMVEQVFAASQDNPAAALPQDQLEGAELVLLAALTAFDPGVGGTLPVPILLGHDSSFGLARIGLKRGYTALDLRLVDVATGRVVQTVAVEGRHSRFNFGFDVFADVGRQYIPLPNALQIFSNTPVERALQEMVIQGVSALAVGAAPGP